MQRGPTGSSSFPLDEACTTLADNLWFLQYLPLVKLVAPSPGTRIAIAHTYTPKPLLTATEARFHAVLAGVSGDRCLIQVKPRLADVFAHEKGDTGGFAKISQKHVDFLICRHGDWTPMLGIELDDDSHERAERKRRDCFVNELFASAGVPLLRIHVSEIDHMENLVHILSHAWVRRSHGLQLELPAAACS